VAGLASIAAKIEAARSMQAEAKAKFADLPTPVGVAVHSLSSGEEAVTKQQASAAAGAALTAVAEAQKLSTEAASAEDTARKKSQLAASSMASTDTKKRQLAGLIAEDAAAIDQANAVHVAAKIATFAERKVASKLSREAVEARKTANKEVEDLQAAKARLRRRRKQRRRLR